MVSTASQNKNYLIYTISTKNNTINVLDKVVNLSLFYSIEDSFRVSNALKLNLDYKLFNYATQISVIQAISKDIAEKYNKIVQLTELNLNMYKELEETLKEVDE